jgi:hypothetical protein
MEGSFLDRAENTPQPPVAYADKVLAHVVGSGPSPATASTTSEGLLNSSRREGVRRRPELRLPGRLSGWPLILAEGDTPPVPATLSPHSLRRTFASLLYLRGESPVYVMHQMGHTDPKLALRIYTKVMGEQRRRGPGARLVGVLDGATWTQAEEGARSRAGELVTTTIG